MDDLLHELLQEEEELQFTSFNEDTAWQLGSWFVAQAIEDDLPITIDITRAGHQLFHASRPGTSVDNDEWVRRKVRLVYRMGHSSYYVGRLLARDGVTIEDKFLISEQEYAPHGGCFPVILKGTGMIGTITVSGLAQEDDHKLVVQAIRHYLSEQG